MSIGERLRSLRISRGLTIEDVARRLNMSFSAIAMYERGERTPPSDKLQVLADFYRVSADYLLGRDEPKGPASVNDLMVQYFRGYDELTEQDKREIRATLDALIAIKRRRKSEQRK